VSEKIGPLPNVNAAINTAIPPVIYFKGVGGKIQLHWKLCDGVLQGTQLLAPGAKWNDIPTKDNTYIYSYEQGVNSPTVFFRLHVPGDAHQP
jgi:hypothetical protein